MYSEVRRLSEPEFLPHFHHIYVEHGAEAFGLTGHILKKFPKSRVIPIKHYKDVFSRPGQGVSAQRKSRSLILALGRAPFLYRGAEVCPSFGNRRFYYSSTVMNCIFDCEYCYLQGMYPSANLVVFVNVQEVFAEVEAVIGDAAAERREGQPGPLIYLCNSYDTDLLAIRNIAPLADMWLDFACKHPELLIEMRTKSAAATWLSDFTALDNVIVAWTLSPDVVSREYEHGAPPLAARLAAARKAAEAGWRIRICLDPILFISSWKKHYGALVETVFRELSPDMVESVSYGMFRMGRDLLKRARKVRPFSALLAYPFVLDDGVYTYPSKISRPIMDFVHSTLSSHLPPEKIFPVPPYSISSTGDSASSPEIS